MYRASNKHSGFTLAEVLVVIIILMLLLSICLPVGINWSNGTGEKIGQIVKLSKQGFKSKTWEGQIIRGGMTDGSGAFGTVPFNFTVEDEATAQKIDAFMRSQTEVVITYRIEGIYSKFRSESRGHFLVSVEPMKKPVEPVKKPGTK